MAHEKLWKTKVVFRFLLVGMLGFGLLLGIAGCREHDDDDRVIEICNGDDEEYTVNLHRYSDGVVIRDLHLEEWYDLNDHCDDFENPPEGRYYLTIYENGGSEMTDRSKDFYLDDGDYHAFRIDSTGTIDD